jgi:hypothetical protein
MSNSASTAWVTSMRLCRLVQFVAIDDLADDRLVLRRRQRDRIRAGLDALAHRLQQPAPACDLVQEREHRSALAPVDRRGGIGGRVAG